MFRPLNSMEGGVGLQRNAADVRIQLFQSARGSDECSRCPEHGNEVRDAAFGLLPDFIGRGQVMRPPVGFIRILVSIKIKIGMAFGQLARNLDRSIGPFRGIGEDDICAISL